MRKIGVLVNPYAGVGVKKEIVSEVISKISPEEVYLPIGKLGEDFVDWTLVDEFDLKKIRINYRNTREDTEKVVNRLNEVNLDCLVVFGGDGTMSDVSHSINPLLCIPCGSTNVSPLMVIESPDSIEKFFSKDIEDLKLVSIDGLKLEVDGIEYNAFNDVVVGSTIISMVNGRRTQISAKEFLKGRKIVAKPKKFFAKLRVGERELEGVFGNIFISPVDRRFFGKGIAGGSAMSVFLGFDAVIALIDEPMIYHYRKDEFRKLEPFVTRTISFDEGETVEITTDEVVSRDGTPIKDGGEFRVKFRRGIVKVYKV